MKKFLHVVSGSVLCLLALVAGGIFVYVPGYQPERFYFLLTYAEEHAHYMVAGGGVLVLLSVCYFITLVRSKRGPSFVSFDTADGSVSISRTAISDFVRKLGDEFAAIVSLDPVVFADRRHQLTLVLNLNVRAGTRVPELSKVLQERVRESLRDDLGFADIKKVSVRVQKIVGSPASPVAGDCEV